jgi:hypothetical protein
MQQYNYSEIGDGYSFVVMYQLETHDSGLVQIIRTQQAQGDVPLEVYRVSELNYQSFKDYIDSKEAFDFVQFTTETKTAPQ